MLIIGGRGHQHSPKLFNPMKRGGFGLLVSRLRAGHLPLPNSSEALIYEPIPWGTGRMNEYLGSMFEEMRDVQEKFLRTAEAGIVAVASQIAESFISGGK